MQVEIRAGVVPAEAVALATSVGWEWSEAQVARVVSMEPEGAFTARAPDGAPVGIVTCVAWPRDAGALAWIGSMVVDERARGRGVGRALLRRAMEHAREKGAGVVGLDATPMGRPLYESEGFARVAESALWSRPEGPPRAPGVPSGEHAIYPVSSCEIMELLEYDRPRFGAGRGPWLAALIAERPHQSFVAVHRKTGAFSGHVLAMEGRIGPLVADSPAAAAWLLHACEKAGTPAKAIVPTWNPEAERLFAAAGYEKGRACLRMTKGGPLPGRQESVYAVAGWSVG